MACRKLRPHSTGVNSPVGLEVVMNFHSLQAIITLQFCVTFVNF